MIHFLSDLHLTPAAPGVTRLFLDYLSGPAQDAERLFILGDLFEAWPGDDVLDDPEESDTRIVVEALKYLCRSGTEVAVLRGNRDFLLGGGFAERSGARLLPDPFELSNASRNFVLSHGDALCTDDAEYQAFRKQVRDEAWQTLFLAKPLSERKAIAAALRLQSEASKRDKSSQAMDLNPQATCTFLRQHGLATLIHGHTHRPGQHEHEVDGQRVERWVLADWHADRGEYLQWDGRHLSRQTLP